MNSPTKRQAQNQNKDGSNDLIKEQMQGTQNPLNEGLMNQQSENILQNKKPQQNKYHQNNKSQSSSFLQETSHLVSWGSYYNSNRQLNNFIFQTQEINLEFCSQYYAINKIIQPLFNSQIFYEKISQLNPRVLQICTGDNHVLMLDESNRVFSQGSNIYGQLGFIGIDYLDKFSCIQALHNRQIQQISCGSDFSFALSSIFLIHFNYSNQKKNLKAKGEVFSWGQNIKGQLGQGISYNLFVPTIVETLKQKEGLQKNIKTNNQIRSQSSEKILDPYQQAHFIKRSESLDKLLSGLDKFAAENNIDLTQKNDTKLDITSQPILEWDEKVSQISCGALHTLALTSHGRVFSTGFGDSFALGHGNDQSTKIFNEVKCFSTPPLQRQASKISELNSSILSDDEYVEFIQCGLVHSLCFTNKRIFAWGIVTEDHQSVFQFPQEILIEDVSYPKENYQQRIVDIQCGQSLTLLLTRGGNVYTIGKLPGEVLQKQRTPIHIARKIKSLSQISKICVGGTHCLAYSKEQKKIFGWGNNSSGQLELSSLSPQIATPIEIANILQESQVVILACGPTSSFIITDQPCQVNKLSLTKTKEKNDKLQNNEAQPASPIKKQQSIDIEIVKAELDKQKQVLIQKNNELQKEIEQMTNDNFMLIQEEERSANELSKLKNQMQLYERELNAYQQQQAQMIVKQDKNIKFKISNSERFKNVTSRTFYPNLEINYSDLEIQNKITEGGYGIIYKAKWREIIVAVKKFKLDYNNQQQVAEFITECNAMEALRHPNIVLFLGACTQINNFCIIMEYCQRGSLWSLLQNQSVPLTWEDRRKIALDIAKAVYFLHSAKPPIIHRDLKSLNVLVDDNFRCKLTDFGWTRVKPQDNYMTNKIGTYQWMAPEVVKGFYYTEKADVFSYSIILWEIASREPPYKGIKGDIVAQDVYSKNLRPVIPQNTPRFFRSLIEQCWEADPDKRPSFKEIVKNLEVMVVE